MTTKKSIYREQYLVKFRYKKSDGFWETKTESILIPVLNQNCEKKNHNKACDVVLKQYPNATIINCCYS